MARQTVELCYSQELKALVDSFPHHQRGNVIKMLEITFRKLNADDQSRHSVDLQPEARADGVLPAKTTASPALSDGFQNENQE